MAEDDGLVNYNGKQVPLSSLPKNSQGKWTPVKSTAKKVQVPNSSTANSATDALQTTTGSAINQGYGNKAKISVPTNRASKGGLASALSAKKFGAKMMASRAKN